MKYIWYFCVSMIALGALLVLLASSNPQHWRSQLSYLLKHTPLCWAENVGFIETKRAHFLEELGTTIDIRRCTPTKPPKMVGNALAHDLVVVSDLGGLVQRFGSNGHIIWQRRLNLPRGIDIVGDSLFIGEGQTLRVLNLSTGFDLKAHKFNHAINNIRVIGNDLYILFDIKGIGAVRHYDYMNGYPVLINSSNIETHFARGLHVDESGLYVADTYQHRVLHLELKTLDLLNYTPARFPMSLKNLGKKFLVVEDLNVVSEFNKMPLERLGSRVGCRRPSILPELMNATDLVFCELEESLGELYSPNDADIEGDYVYVADTHHHRIVVFFKDRVVAQITGFNNPVNVRVAKIED